MIYLVCTNRDTYDLPLNEEECFTLLEALKDSGTQNASLELKLINNIERIRAF